LIFSSLPVDLTLLPLRPPHTHTTRNNSLVKQAVVV
jgi:hypothetical protein